MTFREDYRSGRDAVVSEAPAGCWAIFKILALLILLAVALGAVGTCAGWFGSAAAVVRETIDPREMLRKYETFKQMHAQLAAKKASIDIYDEGLRADLAKDPATLPRDVRQDIALRRQEVAGMRASFNALAADYNASMAKANFRFCNVGMLPEGASEPLPREYVPYMEGSGR